MKKTSLKVLALTGIVSASMFAGAYAASNNQQIQAMLNRDIKVVYNGQTQAFADANGAVVYPISYNGSTYLPVRAISELVELPIEWVASTNTILLGSSEIQPMDVTKLDNDGGKDGNFVINDKAELTIAGSDANQEFTSGVYYEIWNGSASVSDYRLMNFTLPTGATELTYTGWSDIDATMEIYNQDFEVIASYKSTAGTMSERTITIPAGTTSIAFAANGEKAGTDGNAKFMNPTVK